jgi:hypothetical protein
MGQDVPTAGDDLTEPEQRLCEAINTGDLVDLRTGPPTRDVSATGYRWGAKRRIRAQVVYDLLTGSHPSGLRPRALRLRGARITGILDLEAMTVLCPLVLRDCYFDQPIILTEARAPSIRLPGTYINTRGGRHGINGQQLEIGGNLELDEDFAGGGINLFGAHIGGCLILSGATLVDPNDLALVGDGLTVDQDMICRRGFTATGEIRLLGAHIAGQLSFASATLTNHETPALTADQMTVGRGMFCHEGFTATGEVRLSGAQIGGQLELSGATLTNHQGAALTADGLTVEGDMFCRGLTATGEVRLPTAHIGGEVAFTGATLTNPKGPALIANDVTIGQSLFCDQGFSATGEIRLSGAKIAGQLAFAGATLTNHQGPALIADGLAVKQNMFCHQGLNVTGETRMLGAHVAGQLDLTDATLTNPGGRALSADQAQVDRGVDCSEKFTATGKVSLIGAHIGGKLNFAGATLTNPGEVALDLEDVNARTLILAPEAPSETTVSLTGAHVGILADTQARWPKTLHLDGFTYDALQAFPEVDAKARLRWLELHPGGYTPQPYEQLIAAYRRVGHDQAARTVAIAKQRRRRTELNWPGRLWNALLAWTVGYGYRTWQALLWLGAFLLAGWVIFGAAYPTHMTPAKRPPEPTPSFQPAMYSLDTLLPVVDLHQQDYWIPQGLAQWWAWVSILAGWVLTTAVVAALTGILKRD